MDMVPRRKQCASCPFRHADEDYRKESAITPAEDWPCHTEYPWGGGDIECRGHYEAQIKHPPSAEQVAALMRWREERQNDFQTTRPIITEDRR